MFHLIATWLLACSAAPDTFVDVGTACIDGQSVVVAHDLIDLYSCDVLIYGTCEARVDGDALDVTVEFLLRRGSGFDCEEDPGTLVARCALPDLDTPPTVVRLGETEVAWEDAACVEDTGG